MTQVTKLRRLESRMEVWSHSADATSEHHYYVDISGIFEILEIANDENNPSEEGSVPTIFGSTLISQIPSRDARSEPPTQLPIIKPVEQDVIQHQTQSASFPSNLDATYSFNTQGATEAESIEGVSCVGSHNFLPVGSLFTYNF